MTNIKELTMKLYSCTEEEYDELHRNKNLIPNIAKELFALKEESKEIYKLVGSIQERIRHFDYRLGNIYDLIRVLPPEFSSVGAIVNLYKERNQYKNRCEWYEELLEKHNIKKE